MKINSQKLSHTIYSENKIKEYTDNAIIDGIRTNCNATIGFIYKNNYPKIKKMVLSFKNTILQPDDIFQEGLTHAVINIKNDKFRGESSFSTYLNSICRNICLKEISKHNYYFTDIDLKNEEISEDFELIDIVVDLIKDLDEKCRTIIELRFNISAQNNKCNTNDDKKNLPFKEIAKKTGLSTENARQRFKRCLEKFREMVMNNSIIREYYQ